MSIASKENAVAIVEKVKKEKNSVSRETTSPLVLKI